MPRAGQVKPRSGDRLPDRVGVGVLTRSFPPGLVDEVVAGQGCTEQRSRLLPARMVVYYVLALFASGGYEEVMRRLVAGLGVDGALARVLAGAVVAGDLQGPLPVGPGGAGDAV